MFKRYQADQILYVCVLPLFLIIFSFVVNSSAATVTKQYTLTVTSSEGGTVTSLPAGIICGADCAEIFNKGKKVKLTAQPNAGYTFKGWGGGACKGANTVCNLSITGDKTVTATFVLPDLSAKWQKSSAKSISDSQYTVSGKLAVYSSQGSAANVKAKIYLSDNDILDETLTEIGTVTFGTIKAGRSVSKKLKYNSTTKTLGKYLIAVIDADAEITETNKNNNMVISDRCYNHTLSVGTAPPAGAYCDNLGYTLEARKDADGNESGVCIFPDGSECDEWSFYRGQCGQQYSYCEINGHTLKHVKDVPFAYGVCIFSDGSKCAETEYFTNQCGPSECNDWILSKGGCRK